MYENALTAVLRALPMSIRDTDVVGWYKHGSLVGVIFSELGAAQDEAVEAAVLAKVAKVLHSTLPSKHNNDIRVSLQILPETSSYETKGKSYVFTVFGDLVRSSGERQDLPIGQVLDPEPEPAN